MSDLIKNIVTEVEDNREQMIKILENLNVNDGSTRDSEEKKTRRLSNNKK